MAEKIEGVPPAVTRTTESATAPEVGGMAQRDRAPAPKGEGYASADTRGDAPPSMLSNGPSPAVAGLNQPESPVRAATTNPKVARADVDAARRAVVAWGLKGETADQCANAVAEVATTWSLPVKEVVPQYLVLLRTVGAEQWDLALAALSSAAAWSHKRQVALTPLVESLRLLIEKRGPGDATEALVDFVMIGMDTSRDRSRSILDATREFVA